MNKDYFDDHHLIPKHPFEEEKGVKGVSTPNNLLKIKRQTHEAIHTLFKNEPPISQVVKLLQMNETCFDEEFYNDILRFIQSRVNTRYKKECYKGTLRAEMRRILDINI